MQQQIDEIDTTDVMLIMGDWNAKVGTDRASWPENIGQYGFGDANDRRKAPRVLLCQSAVHHKHIFPTQIKPQMDMVTPKWTKQEHDRLHHC